MERSLKTFQELWTEIGDVQGVAGDGRQTLRADSLRGTLPPLPPMTVDQGMHTDADLAVTSILGEGGMGTVFLATQRSLDREVAIKQLKPDATEAHRVGLLREGRFMGTLEHPNIVPVHAMGLDQEGLPTLVMKRIDGTSWEALLHGRARWEEHGSWPTDPLLRSVQVLIEVCKAVQFAHSRGVIHRDLKPSNVMIGGFGEVYVVDWGIACRWRDRDPGARLVGTPAYMAPEMVDPGRAVDPRTDVYLLGACLHEALTGEPPHGGSEMREVLARAHASVPPELPGVPEELAELCRTALAADPAERPADVGAFRGALVAFVQHQGANRLAVEAERRLEQIDALLAEAPDHPGAQALFREAEFAFRQARVEWEGSARAARGLERLLASRIRWNLARGEPEAADGDLAAADQLDVGLSEDLRVEVGRALDEWKELRARARQEDLRPGYRERKRAIVGLLASISVAGLLQSERLMSPWVPYGTGWLLGLVAVAMVLHTGGTVALRRRILADHASRRLVGLLTANGFVLFLHRAWGWFFGLETWEVLGGELLIFSVTALATAIFIRRAFVLWAVVAVTSAVLVGVWPSWAGEVYLAGLLVIFAQIATVDRSHEVS